MGLMQKVGINVQDVLHCALTSKEDKLQHERDNQAWSPRALRINGWRYSGILDADLVTRAICSGFIRQPAECSQIVQPRNPFMPFVPSGNQNNGVTFGQLIAWLGGIVIFICGALLLYKRSLKKD